MGYSRDQGMTSHSTAYFPTQNFRARCVPLQYPSSAIAGVKQAQNFNKHSLNQNMIVVSTPLQEKISASEKALNTYKKESADPVSQSESGMFYELSNKNRMECEKYQDCSWFQQSPTKLNCNTKSSLAETVDSFVDADEFELPMQYANAPPCPLGEEYLEVFPDDIIFEDNFKLGEKYENFYTNYKDEDNAFDSCNSNFTLKKTDSFDSMKNISSTNPAEVIPISYKERLSNSSYGMTKLDEGKREIKEEIELYSPESNSYLMDSDESDLNIGREEVVEEMNSAEDLYIVNKKETVCVDTPKCEEPVDKVPSDYAVNGSIIVKETDIQEENFKPVSLPLKTKNYADKNSAAEKLDLNLDLAKLNFDQTLNVGTPDLDFMDLVDFINEEMRQENNNPAFENSTSNNMVRQKSDTSEGLISTQNQDNVDVQSSNALTSQDSSTQDQSFGSNASTDVKDNSTVDFNEISGSGVSIAERIKTSAKRRTRKTIQDRFDTEDEESYDSVDDDEDYDYKEDIAKRRSVPIKRRTLSTLSESSGDGKKAREESISYRERRDKNNEASRRSRQNRKARERHMYETLEEEERRNVKLKAEADVLEKQVTSLRQLLLQVVIRKGGAT